MATKPRNRQAEILAEWNQAATATAANAADLAYLENQRARLASLHDEFRNLSTQQDVLAASRQEISKRMQEILKEGNRIADFLRTGARQQYGPESEKLVEFGIRPFRGLRRKKTEPDTPTAPPPNPSVE